MLRTLTLYGHTYKFPGKMTIVTGPKADEAAYEMWARVCDHDKGAARHIDYAPFADSFLSPVEQVNLLDVLREKHKDADHVFVSLTCSLALHNYRPELGDAFYNVEPIPDAPPAQHPATATGYPQWCKYRPFRPRKRDGAPVHNHDPRLMSASQLLCLLDGIDDYFPGKCGQMSEDYAAFASNPFRSDEDEVKMWDYKAKLDEAGIKVVRQTPTPRRKLSSSV